MVRRLTLGKGGPSVHLLFRQPCLSLWAWVRSVDGARAGAVGMSAAAPSAGGDALDHTVTS